MKNKCDDCGNCCRETEMILSTRDVDRIKNCDLKSVKIANFVKKNEDGMYQLINIDKSCVFLDISTNLCKIYEFRPKGCRYYPLIFDPSKKKCVLDHDCPRPELFYPTQNSRQENCKKIVRFLEKEVLFSKLL